MSMNIECDWSYATWEALCKSKKTGQADLCDAARHVVRDLANWGVGPSFRGYVINADSYVRIRTEGHGTYMGGKEKEALRNRRRQDPV
jgi:hypothetical protein